MAAETPGRAFAATWRNERGEVVGTTFGGTMCLRPRKPWRIRFHRDGFEGVIRCGECPGCLEFDRRRLADRLHAKYSSDGCAQGAGHGTAAYPSARSAAGETQRLFVVRIYAPIEMHAAISHKLHRRRGLQLEPGMWRLGASSFAVLSREATTLPLVLRQNGVKFRIEPLRLRRGRRAWRSLTAGLIVAREIYGEQTKRWYARGLPAAEREKWEVIKIAKYKSYDRARSPRARTDRRLVLVPPDVWKLSRTDRRFLHGLLTRQPDPEGVRKVMGLVADTLRKAGSSLLVSAPPKAVLGVEQVREWYRRYAERSRARTTSPTPDQDLTPTSEVGGYVSSGHEQGELMPEQLAAARRKEQAERKKRRLQWEAQEIIERMRKKSEGW